MGFLAGTSGRLSPCQYPIWTAPSTASPASRPTRAWSSSTELTSRWLEDSSRGCCADVIARGGGKGNLPSAPTPGRRDYARTPPSTRLLSSPRVRATAVFTRRRRTNDGTGKPGSIRNSQVTVVASPDGDSVYEPLISFTSPPSSLSQATLPSA